MGRIWIPGGGGGGADVDVVTATAGDVLTGKIIVGSNGEPVTGTMPNRGAVSQALNCGGSYTIPAGYHNGSGKVTANSLASQTTVQSGKTAIGAAQVLTGYEGWVNGNRITGTMANQGAKTSSLNCGGSYTIPAGYHNGSGKITANSLSSQTSATAAAGDILTGKTAWVNGTKLTGSMATLAGGTYKSTTSNQTISCSGKKMTSNITITGDSNLVAANILSGKTILGVAGNAQAMKEASFIVAASSTTTSVYNYDTESNKNLYKASKTNGYNFTPKHVIAYTSELNTDGNMTYIRGITVNDQTFNFIITYSSLAGMYIWNQNSSTIGSGKAFYINTTSLSIPTGRPNRSVQIYVVGT